MRRLLPLGIVVLIALEIPRASIGHPSVHDELRSLASEAKAHPAAQVYLRMAELHRLGGELAAAAEDLERAASIDPEAPELDLCRGALALDQGRPEEALIAVGRCLERFPDEPKAFQLRARVRIAQRDLIGAASDLERVVRDARSPNPDLYVERARLLMEAGRGDAAMAALDEGIERLGSIASLELAAVEMEAARGDVAAALARLDERLARIGRPGTWLWKRAELLRRMGDARAAGWAVAAGEASALDRSGLPEAPASTSIASSPAVVEPPARPAHIAATVTRGPYLCDASSSRITVRWRTDVATDSRVRYGTTLASLNLTVYDPVSTTEHVVPVVSLSADTRYYYTIGTGTQILSGGDAQTSFVASPTPGVAKPTRLWVIGDSGTGGAGAIAVRDAFSTYAAGTKPADLWLMLGDNAYSNGTDAEYQAGVFNVYPALLRNTVLWPTRGNHDVLYSGANNDYYDLFTLPIAAEAGGLASGSEAYYSFDYGNIHFVCLDSEGSDRSVGGPMAVWLRADLAATPRDWVIAFWHHPPYSKGSHDSDNDLDSGGRMGDMRRNILPILDSTGVDLVLSGHSHNYERSFLLNGHYGTSTALTEAMKVDAGNGRWNGDGAYTKSSGTLPREGCVYTVDGVGSETGGGSLNHPVMVSSLNVLGSMVIDVVGNRLDARFIDTQPAVLDSFTIMKGISVGVHEPPRGAPGLRLLSAQPSRGSVRFAYRLPVGGQASLVVLDALGRRVRMLRSGREDPGEHQTIWDGADDGGRACPAGVYFAVLEMPGRHWARKIVRLGP